MFDETVSFLPYCKCFKDFSGADCSVITRDLRLGEDINVTLLQGSSKLLTAIVSDPEVELSVKAVKGSLSIYTKTVSMKRHAHKSVQMGIESNWASHANIPSAVNYDSKFDFESETIEDRFKLKFSGNRE